ncbi:hypothetical protein BTO22_13490, partial [Aliivibrio sifiae]
MYRSEVTHLYKYRAFNEFTLDIIANNKVYLPKPVVFNDPYDCKIEIDKNVSMTEYLTILKHDAARYFVPNEQLEMEILKVKNQGVIR